MTLYALRYEEQAHMCDHVAGIYTSKELAEDAKIELLANPNLKHFSIYPQWVWIEELPAINSTVKLHKPK